MLLLAQVVQRHQEVTKGHGIQARDLFHVVAYVTPCWNPLLPDGVPDTLNADIAAHNVELRRVGAAELGAHASGAGVHPNVDAEVLAHARSSQAEMEGIRGDEQQAAHRPRIARFQNTEKRTTCTELGKDDAQTHSRDTAFEAKAPRNDAAFGQSTRSTPSQWDS